MSVFEKRSGKLARYLFTILVAVGFAFHMYTGGYRLWESMTQQGIHLIIMALLAVLAYPMVKPGKGPKWLIAVDALLGLAAVVSIRHVVRVYASGEIFNRFPNNTDIIMATVLVVVVLEISRRVMGIVLPIVAIVFLLYALFGQYSPILPHRGFSISHTMSAIVLSLDGVFSAPLSVSATFLVLFLIFTGILQAAGAGNFILKLSQSLLGHVRGGPAKVAVVGSALFGTISGSAVANVVGTGTFTIPMMKGIGYRPHFAGAVEAAASTGGQLVPPIMGATAFVMSELTGIPYARICLAAMMPALFYYVCLFFQVDIEAVKSGLKGLPRSDLPRLWPVLKEGWHYSIPTAVLVFLLAVAGWSMARIAVWAIVTTVLVSLTRKSSRRTPQGYFAGVENGFRSMIVVTFACAVAGIVIGSIGFTGLWAKLSTSIRMWSGGNLTLLLVLTMVASLVLGMGMPTIPAYLFLAMLVAPAMTSLGIETIVAHMFIFYFGLLSAVTPPVAVAAFAGAGIAGSSPMRVGYTAARLCVSGFLVPFLFVYNPAMLVITGGSTIDILAVLVAGLVMAWAAAGAVSNHLITKCALWEQILLALVAVGMIVPTAPSRVAGIVVVAGIVLNQWLRVRRLHEARLSQSR